MQKQYNKSISTHFLANLLEFFTIGSINLVDRLDDPLDRSTQWLSGAQTPVLPGNSKDFPKKQTFRKLSASFCVLIVKSTFGCLTFQNFSSCKRSG